MTGVKPLLLVWLCALVVTCAQEQHAASKHHYTHRHVAATEHSPHARPTPTPAKVIEYNGKLYDL